MAPDVAGAELRVDVSVRGWPAGCWDTLVVALGADDVGVPDGLAVPGASARSGALRAGDGHAVLQLERVGAEVARVHVQVCVREDVRHRGVHGRQIQDLTARLSAGGRVVAEFTIDGSLLGQETAISVFELYRRDGWRVMASGTGFVGGLPSVLARYRVRLPDGGVAPPRPAPTPGGRPPTGTRRVGVPSEWPGGAVPAIPGGLTSAVGMLLVETHEGVHGGTAFAIGPGGWLVTCHHCVEGARRIEWIAEGSDERRTATVEASDPEGDLALLHLADRAGTPRWLLVAPLEQPARLGDELGLLGYPLGAQLGVALTYSQGVVNSLRRKGDVDVLQVDTGAAPGSSGGPVFRRTDGRVVGVLTSGITQTSGMLVNFATRTDRLSALAWLGPIT